MKPYYRIIYLNDDPNSISVARMMPHEESLYRFASRIRFDDYEESLTCGKNLAKTHGKQYVDPVKPFPLLD